MATTITGSGVDNIIDGTITNADINASAAIVGSKLNGAGKVLQVVQVADTSHSILGSSLHTLMSLSLTPLVSNSSFILMCTVTHGMVDVGNNDAYDIALQFTRQYAGSTQVSIGGNPSVTRNAAYSGGALYATDVPLSTQDTQYDVKYESFTRTFNHKDSPSVSAGTTLTYKLMVNVQTSYYRNKTQNGTSNGGQSSLIVMEVAP
jgi:hypothetical protein